MGGMSIEHPLPADGVDLRHELAEHQRSRVEQALARAKGDTALAAKLLRVTPLDLVRMQAGHISAAGAKSSAPGKERREPLSVSDLPRIERGLEVISRAAIRRLHAEGRTPAQIAARLGVNHFVIEKVLRAEAELAKCGPAPEPEQKA
jgi:hypothetical protein